MSGCGGNHHCYCCAMLVEVREEWTEREEGGEVLRDREGERGEGEVKMIIGVKNL